MDGPKVGLQDTRNLEDIDEEQTELHDRPASKLLTPGGPEFASQGVEDQEDHLAHTRSLLTDAKLLGQGVHGIGVDARVEVHGHLHEGDDRQDAPFVVPGPGEAKLVVAFLLGQLPLAVQTGLDVSLAVVVG